jgi:arsenate reductase (thioredoxin)
VEKARTLFLCTHTSARSQMAKGLPRHLDRERFEAYSAGFKAAEEIHPYVKDVMDEVGIDTSEQYPKGLRTYMGNVGFNYSIIVCARAERNCPKTFPGVGTRLVWIFEDPRSEDVPEEEMLDKFREIRDQIELKIKGWLEHPEEELARLRAERERERQERLKARRETRSHLVVTDEPSAKRARSTSLPLTPAIKPTITQPRMPTLAPPCASGAP